MAACLPSARTDRLETPAGALGDRPVRALRRHLSSERGQAMVEMALVLPILVLLVVGMLVFGRAVNYWLDMNHLASEGARLAAVDNATPGGKAFTTYLRDQGTTPELRNGMQICVDLSEGAGELGDPVTVKVSAPYHLLPLDKLFGGDGWGDVTIRGEATMRLETTADAITAVPGC